jgi:hypothetical protein
MIERLTGTRLWVSCMYQKGNCVSREFWPKIFKDVPLLYGEKILLSGYIASRTPRPYPMDFVSVVPGSFIGTGLS